jgi:hypothetical protein
LTCLLGSKIKDRVVSVASAMYHFAQIHIDDLNWQTWPTCSSSVSWRPVASGPTRRIPA